MISMIKSWLHGSVIGSYLPRGFLSDERRVYRDDDDEELADAARKVG